MIKNVKRRTGKSIIIYFILILALLNGPLRLTANGITSFYRILSPFLVAVLLGKHFNYYKRDLLVFSGMILYSFCVSVVFYRHIAFDQTVVLIYIFFVYVIMKYQKRKDRFFESHFFRFLDITTHITIVLAWLQYVFHYTVPFMEISRGQPIGVYLSNGNELSEALMCMLIVYAYLILIYSETKYIPACVSILFITFINDNMSKTR